MHLILEVVFTEFDPTEHYNPYVDATLHELKAEPPVVDHREPFNDAIKYGDMLAGHQQNRVLSDYPKKMRRKVRLWSMIALAWVMATFVYGLITMFRQ
jgi:hypothetical protein